MAMPDGFTNISVSKETRDTLKQLQAKYRLRTLDDALKVALDISAIHADTSHTKKYILGCYNLDSARTGHQKPGPKAQDNDTMMVVGGSR